MNKIIKNFKNIKYGPAPEDNKDVVKWINELEKPNKLKNQQEKINIEKREGEIKKNKIKNILDNYFLTNTDVSITFDIIVENIGAPHHIDSRSLIF